MEKKHLDEIDRLDAKYDDSRHENNKKVAWSSILKKYGKEYDSLCEAESKLSTEYQEALTNVSKEYLGKYADKRIKDITAAEALSTQIDWGINIGKLKTNEILRYKQSKFVK